MWISRVRVTGGFLNGLDVTFTKGLNVIIGARGAGKTTLLELIRHAIGAKHADDRQARQHQEFLKAVLGTGEVILDLHSDDGGRHLVVDAKGGGQRPDLSNAVLVLGQNELESIASDAASRLNLLDLRSGAAAHSLDRSGAAELTAKLFALRETLEEREEESAKRVTLQSDREVLASQEAALLGGSDNVLSAKREDLRGKEEALIRSSRDLRTLLESQSLLDAIVGAQEEQGERLNNLRQKVESMPQASDALEYITKAVALSADLARLSNPIRRTIADAAEETSERNLQLREASAPLRASLEEAESGLGQITSQLRNIDAELQALDENEKQINFLKDQYVSVSKERDTLLDAVEAQEEAIYALRSDLATRTTGQIANNVVIIVEHLADSGAFRETLVRELKGSNTRAVLIDSLADRVLPRQLMELVEAGDAPGLAAAADIAVDRAEKLLTSLNNESALRALSDVSLTDNVDFRLMDGSTDKSVDNLSTGQKCAVTLPVILSERERTLILDQPEDHLDNAYLVAHVVTGITNRKDAQTIVATHNANIPVLGSASKVFVLQSDGRNGAVSEEGQYDDPRIVSKITGLMEGGREAFAKRVDFYAAHGQTP
jgi:energy-coupling factor transporter ATP-binding protein EcfA2